MSIELKHVIIFFVAIPIFSMGILAFVFFQVLSMRKELNFLNLVFKLQSLKNKSGLSTQREILNQIELLLKNLRQCPKAEIPEIVETLRSLFENKSASSMREEVSELIVEAMATYAFLRRLKIKKIWILDRKYLAKLDEPERVEVKESPSPIDLIAQIKSYHD